MPRPKGSKNRKTKAEKAVIMENVDEKLAAVEAEIEELKQELAVYRQTTCK